MWQLVSQCFKARLKTTGISRASTAAAAAAAASAVAAYYVVAD